MLGSEHIVTSDVDLVRAWADGDRNAGQALIERHYDALTRFFRTKAHAHAADLLQATFLRCAEGCTRFSGESVRAYLFGIARNVLFEHYRANARCKSHEDMGATSIADLQKGAATALFEQDEQRVLVEALHTLPLDLQSLLELYYWEELDVSELSSVFEIPAGTVKSRLSRGRRLLREALDSVVTHADTRQSVITILDAFEQRDRDASEAREDERPLSPR